MLLQQWDKAATDSGKALELQPADGVHCMEHTSFLLLAGDTDNYRQTCKQMLERFGQTKNRDLAHQIALSCLLIPDAVSDQKLPLELAKRAAAGAPRNDWYEITLGVALYRTGQYQQAVQQLRQVVKTWPEDPYAGAGADGGPVLTWLGLAMAHQRLGQSAEAGLWLNKATRRMDKELAEKEVGPLRMQSHVWAMCQVLRREAEAIAKGTTEKPPRAGKEPSQKK
jgi:tetratricopeptide (TPR) repeat protein